MAGAVMAGINIGRLPLADKPCGLRESAHSWTKRGSRMRLAVAGASRLSMACADVAER